MSALVIEAVIFVLRQGLVGEGQGRLWLHAELRRGAYGVGVEYRLPVGVHLEM